MQWRFQLKGGLTKASNNFKFIFLVRGEITKNAYELQTKRENRKFYISNVYAVFWFSLQICFFKGIARAGGTQAVH